MAVPLSLVGTFGVMYLAGFSINNLTLMALTIATGFVVDDAIVMIENISRYLEEGDAPLEAALKGAEQIGFTIISLTVSLIAVLIPLLFMGDVVGRLFREFAITLAVSILISAVVSLTLTPMMCAKLLHHIPEEKQGRFYRASGRFFDGVIARYGTMLQWVLKHQTLTLAVAVGTLVLTGILYIIIPKGFFPVQDTGAIQGISEAGAVSLLFRHGGAPAGARPRDSRRSGRGQPLLLHRGGRNELHAQQRAFPDQSQAAAQAQEQRARGHPPAAAQARRTARHLALPAAGAGSLDRKHGEPHPIPVQCGVVQTRRTGDLGGTAGRPSARIACAGRRDQRSSE